MCEALQAASLEQGACVHCPAQNADSGCLVWVCHECWSVYTVFQNVMKSQDVKINYFVIVMPFRIEILLFWM